MSYDPREVAKKVGVPGGVRFADMLEYHLNLKLQKFRNANLDGETQEKMYLEIFDTVSKTFEKFGQGVSEECVRWVTENYYELIKVNDEEEVTRDESTWKYKTERFYEKTDTSRLREDELRLLSGIFSETDFADKIWTELKSRGLR